MDVESILDGIATRLSTLAGLRVYPVVPDKIEPPAAVIGLTDIQFDDSMSGTDVVNVEVLLIATAAQGVAKAQEQLFNYLDDTAGIRTAIYGDVTLSGAASYARVISADGPRTVSMAGTDYVGLAVAVEVVS